MKRKTSKRGIAFLVVGALLLLAACGWCLYNFAEDDKAGKQAEELLLKLDDQKTIQTEDTTSPVVVVDGETFCGRVIIKKLNIELPVYDEWDYKRLKSAPCRYVGSVETDDIIIAAHNYKSHFGNLKQLASDDEILFVDIMGKEYKYAVKEIIALDGTAVTDMKAGDWDFTLFTCTKGGKQRITVRCEKVFEE